MMTHTTQLKHHNQQYCGELIQYLLIVRSQTSVENIETEAIFIAILFSFFILLFPAFIVSEIWQGLGQIDR